MLSGRCYRPVALLGIEQVSSYLVAMQSFSSEFHDVIAHSLAALIADSACDDGLAVNETAASSPLWYVGPFNLPLQLDESHSTVTSHSEAFHRHRHVW